MPTDAFIMRYDEPSAFAESFLNSQDFDLDGIREIARQIGIRPLSRNRESLVAEIVYELKRTGREDYLSAILSQLVARDKIWVAVKVGSLNPCFQGKNPTDLLYKPGEAEWYGPLSHPSDGEGVNWYIRPVFIKHCEISKNSNTVEIRYIRWLCFARLTETELSLHWRGFSYHPSSEDPDEDTSGGRHIQFAYWYYIPDIFDEIEERVGASVSSLNLQDIVLHRLWDTYLGKQGYDWTHRRIRAESSGVSLNAHAGRAGGYQSKRPSKGIVEFNLQPHDGVGISHLASTIRKAVEYELRSLYNQELPDPRIFDDIILRTIIREYGAVSYEFSLLHHGRLLFRAHSYFGDKAKAPSQDGFPHMKLVGTVRYHDEENNRYQMTKKLNELEQLRFILQHAR